MNYKSMITQKAQELFELYPIYKEVYVTAESLTAGLIGASIVEIPGSSAYFDRGFITYSNEAKMECLGVSEDTLKSYVGYTDHSIAANGRKNIYVSSYDPLSTEKVLEEVTDERELSMINDVLEQIDSAN